MSNSGSLAVARVMAHCGGAPGVAVEYVAGAIARSPADPEPYGLLGELRDAAPEIVTEPRSLPQFVAGAYFSFLDGDMDLAAQRLGEDGDFAGAAELVRQGLAHEPEEILLRAAGAAYRARVAGSVADLDLLVAPAVADETYRDQLIDCAVAGPGLPADWIDAARRLRSV
jgi:hypothetical protein